jgi:hypothetical protein
MHVRRAHHQQDFCQAPVAVQRRQQRLDRRQRREAVSHVRAVVKRQGDREQE